jgi:hypothetical protein
VFSVYGSWTNHRVAAAAMEKMHVEQEQKKNEEDQKKAKEMEAMHAAQEQAAAEEHQRKAKEMEVSFSSFRSILNEI